MLFLLHISCQMGWYSFVLEGWGVGGLGLKRGTEISVSCLRGNLHNRIIGCGIVKNEESGTDPSFFDFWGHRRL